MLHILVVVLHIVVVTYCSSVTDFIFKNYILVVVLRIFLVVLQILVLTYLSSSVTDFSSVTYFSSS